MYKQGSLKKKLVDGAKSAVKDMDVDMSDLLNISKSYKKKPDKAPVDLFRSYFDIQKEKAMSAFNFRQKVKDNIVHTIDWR